MPHPFRGRRVSERTFTLAIVGFAAAVLLAVVALSYLILSNRQAIERHRVDQVTRRVIRIEMRDRQSNHKRRLAARRRGSARRASGRRSAPGVRSPQAPSLPPSSSPPRGHGHGQAPAHPAPSSPPSAPSSPVPGLPLPSLPQLGIPPLPPLP